MLNIVIGAIILFVFGALWYTYLFGKKWEKLMSFSDESKKVMKSRSMTQGLIGNFVLNFVTVAIVYYITDQVLVLSYSDFVKFILLVWLAFSFPSFANAYLWEGKSWKLVLLNSAYGIIYFVIAGSIVYNWPK